jgi:acyl-CoA dehydrogenase
MTNIMTEKDEQRAMLAETVDRLFAELMADGMPESNSDKLAGWWQRIEELGLIDVFLPEADGGFGGGWADACVVFNLLGVHALPLPVGEALIARKLLLEASLIAPAGMMTVAMCDTPLLATSEAGEFHFSGTASAVPWGRLAQHVVVACHYDNQDQLLLLAGPQGDAISEYGNEAEEPRDDLVFQQAPVIAAAALPDCVEHLGFYGALLRAAQISGALEAALALTVEYVNQREQFGRPLSKFQALQHQLALLAEETAAVKCAAMAAAGTVDKGDARFEMAAAKLRANQAVGEATSIAHQTHGAIGITREHHLHYWTQRLWSWRSEFGNDRYWSNRLGRLVLEEGGENFWQKLTARGDR